ncbi:MAG: glycosyltransferase family A protein [Tunicatimonas sp.]
MNFSVVIPTHNRKELLMRLYESLLLLDYNPASIEVVIIDDGSSDGTAELLESFKTDSKRKFSLKYQVQINQGPAKARNTGIALASHEWIMFTDDDCLVSQQWASAYAAEIRNHQKAELFHGPTLTKRADVTMLTHQIDNAKGSVNFPTCNVCYSKKLLNRIGGFSPDFPYAHNEDAELAWRAISANAIPIFVPNAEVHHPSRKETLRKLWNRPKILTSEFILYQKHPERYKQFRAANPLVNIYVNFFIVDQYYNLRLSVKRPYKPLLTVKSLALVIWWWCYCIIHFGSFLRLHKQTRSYLAQKKIKN